MLNTPPGEMVTLQYNPKREVLSGIMFMDSSGGHKLAPVIPLLCVIYAVV